MIIGVPKEIKDHENRVALVPAGVEALVKAGHQVFVETQAGLGSGITDEEFAEAGAKITKSHEELFSEADMIVKVKEPLTEEHELLHEGQIIFAYLHLAAAPELAETLLEKKVTCFAYETIQLPNGTLPLLSPMSEVAGRLSVQAGARFLQNDGGGKGVLLPGVPGVNPCKVVIIGAGVVGTNAARMAVGMGADVTLLDVNIDRLRQLDDVFGGRIKTLYSNSYNIAASVRQADLVIGAVLIPGGRAPHVVTRDMVATMSDGSVIVDVAVDQGGCIETTRPTTHSNPVYVVDGVVHYCVTNMPGAVARTSTFALTNATLPYIIQLANLGPIDAITRNDSLAKGLNVIGGVVTNKAVAEALGYNYIPINTFLN